ncbi:sensor histidine kinase [Enterococcus faecalis]
MMSYATMEVTMSVQFVLLMHCLSCIFMTWILDVKQVLDKQACLIFSASLVVTSLLLICQAPLPLTSGFFFVSIGLKYFFYIQTFRSWLPGTLLIILKYILIVLSWFLTFDLPRIFLGMDIFNTFFWMLTFHILQQIVLIILAYAVKYLLIKLNFIYRLYSFTFAYKKISLAALLLVTVLSILRQNRSYPDYTETFIFSLFVIVLLLAVSFFLIWITSEKQNEVAALQMKNQYLASEQEASTQLKDFKHDYKNMLIVLAEYLEQERYQESKEYLRKILDYSRQELDFDYYADVYKLKNIDLQNYLFAFITKCKKQQVKVMLTVKGKVQLIPVNPVILVRMIAILADNALEACENIPNSFIHIYIEFVEKSTTFTISNSCSEKVPLEKIMTLGYSTKQQHSGRGLAYLTKISKKLNADLTFTYQKKIFTAVLHFK